MMIRFLPRAAAALVVGALALTACDPDETPQFAPTAGSVDGLVFFDADNDGRYVPTQGDLALPGARVSIVERGTRTQVIGSATADAAGRFGFAAAAGTHDVLVDSASVAPRLFCGGQRVTVRAGEPAFANVVVRGGCVIRIDTAKTRPRDAAVTVAGIVTAAPGRFLANGNNMFVQGLGGGIAVFGPGAFTGLNLQEGDSVEISGLMGNNASEIQIQSPRVAANIRRQVRLVDPLVLRTGQADSSRTPTNSANSSAGGNPQPGVANANVGRLVQVRRARLTAPFALLGNPNNAANGEFADASSPVTLQIRLAGASFPVIGTARFTVGNCYDVTGILGVFNGRPQLLPRTAADVTEVPCT